MSSQSNPQQESPSSSSSSPPTHGHVPAHIPRDTIGGFLSLDEQKGAAEEKYKGRVEESTGMQLPEGQHHGTEGDFMKHKPGGSDTLPGWDKVKSVMHGASE